jgi:hypothetical protein
MFNKLFKKIDNLMQNLTLITIYLIFLYFMLQILRYIVSF